MRGGPALMLVLAVDRLGGQAEPIVREFLTQGATETEEVLWRANAILHQPGASDLIFESSRRVGNGSMPTAIYQRLQIQAIRLAQPLHDLVIDVQHQRCL